MSSAEDEFEQGGPEARTLPLGRTSVSNSSTRSVLSALPGMGMPCSTRIDLCGQPVVFTCRAPQEGGPQGEVQGCSSVPKLWNL